MYLPHNLLRLLRLGDQLLLNHLLITLSLNAILKITLIDLENLIAANQTLFGGPTIGISLRHFTLRVQVETWGIIDNLYPDL
jgi:hypothetical protein